MYTLYGHLGKPSRARHLADAFSDAAAAAEKKAADELAASGFGVVKNTFCLGPKLLRQFDVPTAARIMAKLSAMAWGRNATTLSGKDNQYTTWVVTYHKTKGTNTYVAPAGHYMLLDRRFAADAAWAPADLTIPVTITNDPALIEALSGIGTFANVAPLRDLPTTCPDGTNPVRGVTPIAAAAAAARGFEPQRKTTMDEMGPTTGSSSGGGGDSSGVLILGAVALVVVAAVAMSSGGGRTANPVPGYVY